MKESSEPSPITSKILGYKADQAKSQRTVTYYIAAIFLIVVIIAFFTRGYWGNTYQDWLNMKHTVFWIVIIIMLILLVVAIIISVLGKYRSKKIN